MPGAAQNDRHPVPRWVFGEVFLGDGGDLLYPFFRGQLFKGDGELLIDLGPRGLEIGR